MKYLKKYTFVLLCVAVSGCAQDIQIAERHRPKAEVVTSSKDFAQNSAQPISAFFQKRKNKRIAVSGFEDLSGARIEGGASTAVAASGRILTHYLLLENNKNNQYKLLDRAILNDLLNERRLAAQINTKNENDVLDASPDFLRESLRGKIPQLIKSDDLLPTDYLIYGAVVGYDKRLKDDGAGAGLAGFRLSNRISRDQVSVVLQLISVQTGEIVGIGFGTQFIDSTSLQAGIFAQIKVDRILEYEKADIINDPTTFALIQAIDLALGEMFKNAAA